MSLVLESAGGKGRDGLARNHQYVPALLLLLHRLRDRQAVLLTALVASANLSAQPESQRTLLAGPLELAGVTDIERLRLDITSAQGRIGMPAGAKKEGNNRKRLQLRLDVPGYGPGDAGLLAADLAAPPAGGSQVWPNAGELLRSLIGDEIRTVSGNPNMVLAVHGDTALVRTGRSPTGQPVGIGEVQKGLDKLAGLRSVRVNVDELGHRSAFVGAVLATLPGAQFTDNPATVTLSTSIRLQTGSDPAFAVLDGVAQVKIRKEQAQLRNLLAGDRAQAACALCGHEYPMGFLVAAHVKRRAVCSDDERRDLNHVAMLACSFGCDALYESGWITVDEHGHVRTTSLAGLPESRLRQQLQHLDGRRCTAHSDRSEPYFAWHRGTVFRGTSTP
ncbi:hypothetical protein JOF56_009882 [Kibdelosporangium banguiense]|uniref:HNH endonuclease n=1 Tax=Kibdelosporangium banguiense TaxID=1365924 RepID=A0ABS4TYN3_9PSEU|nr:hypothetical protein [Kibdelosporangium banguiense]MBP2329497.1 hypothetical protein [Kibdelosporangium banguiense]